MKEINELIITAIKQYREACIDDEDWKEAKLAERSSEIYTQSTILLEKYRDYFEKVKLVISLQGSLIQSLEEEIRIKDKIIEDKEWGN